MGFSAISPELAPLLVERSYSVKPRSAVTPSSLRMALLSGVAGYADAAGCVALAGLFPAHITGEVVATVARVSAPFDAHQRARVAVVITFVLAVVVGALVSRAFRQRGRSPLAALLGAMAVSLLAFALSDWLFSPNTSARLTWQGVTVVTAMALQNVVMRRALTSSCPTTVMTGNLTQFTVELVELCFRRWIYTPAQHGAVRARAETRLRVIGIALGAFFLSAVWGGVLTLSLGTIGALLPASALIVLAWRERRHPMALSRSGTLF